MSFSSTLLPAFSIQRLQKFLLMSSFYDFNVFKFFNERF